jgi:hypothetical protein
MTSHVRWDLVECEEQSCPRCESRGCMTVRCEADAPVQDCPGRASRHEHTICIRCEFEWISAGEVPPALRTPIKR